MKPPPPPAKAAPASKTDSGWLNEEEIGAVQSQEADAIADWIERHPGLPITSIVASIRLREHHRHPPACLCDQCKARLTKHVAIAVTGGTNAQRQTDRLLELIERFVKEGI